MADLLSLIHPRALVRHAIVRMFRMDAYLSSIVAGRTYPNREAPWLSPELPACAVYTTDEVRVDAEATPDPLRREMTVVVEFIAEMNQTSDGGLDDLLDSFCLAVENAMDIDAIGAVMGAIVNETLEAQGHDPLPLRSNGRHPADTLVSLAYSGSQLGFAEDGEQTLGAAVLTWSIQYDRPRLVVPLDDFLLAHTEYTVGSDTTPSATDEVTLPPATAVGG